MLRQQPFFMALQTAGSACPSENALPSLMGHMQVGHQNNIEHIGPCRHSCSLRQQSTKSMLVKCSHWEQWCAEVHVISLKWWTSLEGHPPGQSVHARGIEDGPCAGNHGKAVLQTCHQKNHCICSLPSKLPSCNWASAWQRSVCVLSKTRSWTLATASVQLFQSLWSHLLCPSFCIGFFSWSSTLCPKTCTCWKCSLQHKSFGWRAKAVASWYLHPLPWAGLWSTTSHFHTGTGRLPETLHACSLDKYSNNSSEAIEKSLLVISEAIPSMCWVPTMCPSKVHRFGNF